MSTKLSNIILFLKKKASGTSLFIAILAVSTASIFIRKAQQNLPSIVIATYRLLLASVFICPFSVKKLLREKQSLNKENVLLLTASGILLAIHFASWITSLEYTNVISSAVLVTTTPIWVTLFSPLFLKERLPKAFSIGLTISLLGILIIATSSLCTFSTGGIHCTSLIDPERGSMLLGNILALLGAFCAAGYMMVGRKVRKSLSNQSYVFSVYSITAISLLVFSLLTRQPLLQITRQDLIWLVLLALIPQVIGHSLLNWVLGRLPAAYVSLSLLGEPIGAALLAFLLLKEQPTLFELAGSIVIISGIYFATKPRQNDAEPLIS